MRSPELYLSFNEIMFYFSRAAVGGGAPFGLAEDFGRAAIWIAASGIDPADFAMRAIKELECGNSSLKANLKEENKEILLSAESSKKLSAILAGSALSDLISAQPENPNNIPCIIAEKVDCPFIVCAALGASNCKGWEISWTGKDNCPNSVLICGDGGWMSSWGRNIIPEFNNEVDVKVTFVKNHNVRIS